MAFVDNAKRRLATSSLALALILASCGVNDGEPPARDLTAQELELMDAFEANRTDRAYDLLNAPNIELTGLEVGRANEVRVTYQHIPTQDSFVYCQVENLGDTDFEAELEPMAAIGCPYLWITAGLVGDNHIWGPDGGDLPDEMLLGYWSPSTGSVFER